MANTSVVLSGAIDDAGPPAVAQTPHGYYRDGPPYEMPPRPQYQPRYEDNRPPLPFPFFFGR